MCAKKDYIPERFILKFDETISSENVKYISKFFLDLCFVQMSIIRVAIKKKKGNEINTRK